MLGVFVSDAMFVQKTAGEGGESLGSLSVICTDQKEKSCLPFVVTEPEGLARV